MEALNGIVQCLSYFVRFGQLVLLSLFQRTAFG